MLVGRDLLRVFEFWPLAPHPNPPRKRGEGIKLPLPLVGEQLG